MKCIRELHVTDKALHRTEEWREQYRIVQQAHVPVQKLGVIAVLTCTDEVPGNDFISTRCFFFHFFLQLAGWPCAEKCAARLPTVSQCLIVGCFGKQFGWIKTATNEHEKLQTFWLNLPITYGF